MRAPMPSSPSNFSEHLHWAWCDDQLVSLDPARDCYTIHPPGASRRLADDAVRRDLPLPEPQSPRGTPVHDWRLAPGDLAPWRLRWLPLAIGTLHRVHRRARRRRIAGLLELLAAPGRDASAPCTGTRATELVVSSALVATLNAACLLYPARIRCLEWASACVLLGRRLGLRPSLVIGVCNRPFAAHAWVECNDRVLGDDPRRRSQLAVILATPPVPGHP